MSTRLHKSNRLLKRKLKSPMLRVSSILQTKLSGPVCYLNSKISLSNRGWQRSDRLFKRRKRSWTISATVPLSMKMAPKKLTCRLSSRTFWIRGNFSAPKIIPCISPYHRRPTASKVWVRGRQGCKSLETRTTRCISIPSAIVLPARVAISRIMRTTITILSLHRSSPQIMLCGSSSRRHQWRRDLRHLNQQIITT